MALRVREQVLRLSTAGGCFTGSALSCVELLVYLYGQFLRLDRDNLDDARRDYLFFSKGHAVPALYATLVEVGLLERERLDNHLQPADNVYWHPNRQIPGVEFHSGSLGHGLAVAIGVALDCKLRRQDNRVVVVTGDGELNEGSNWEACLVAQAHGLDNLIIVVDRNGRQANRRTEELIPLDPLCSKFRAFGCPAVRVNGHDLVDLDKVFSCTPFALGKPSVLIADTVRGYGVPTIQDRADRWFCDLPQPEAEALIEELHDLERSRAQIPTGTTVKLLEVLARSVRPGFLLEALGGADMRQGEAR